MNKMVYTYEYDRGYLPPFPAIEVKINGFGVVGEPVEVNALVDSGSDVTLVPLSLLQQIKAKKIGRGYLRDVTGARRLADIYEVTLELVGQEIPWLEVVGDDQEEQIILGRDVLNHFAILLNGPANVVEIEP